MSVRLLKSYPIYHLPKVSLFNDNLGIISRDCGSSLEGVTCESSLSPRSSVFKVDPSAASGMGAQERHVGFR